MRFAQLAYSLVGVCLAGVAGLGTKLYLDTAPQPQLTLNAPTPPWSYERLREIVTTYRTAGVYFIVTGSGAGEASAMASTTSDSVFSSERVACLASGMPPMVFKTKIDGSLPFMREYLLQPEAAPVEGSTLLLYRRGSGSAGRTLQAQALPLREAMAVTPALLSGVESDRDHPCTEASEYQVEATPLWTIAQSVALANDTLTLAIISGSETTFTRTARTSFSASFPLASLPAIKQFITKIESQKIYPWQTIYADQHIGENQTAFMMYREYAIPGADNVIIIITKAENEPEITLRLGLVSLI